jgi:hypothetical protein
MFDISKELSTKTIKRLYYYSVTVFLYIYKMINKISYFCLLLFWSYLHLAENVGEGCVPRQESDYKELRNFARTLDADVFALQEVESLKACS